jgi:putative MATE family efflux protein
MGQVIQYFYLIIDTAFISFIDKSSTAIISGTGLVFPLFFIFMSLAVSLNTGVSTLIARGIGEKNPKVIEYGAISACFLAIIIALFSLACGFGFGQNIIQGLAGSQITPEAIHYGTIFFLYLLPGLALLTIIQVFSGILQGEGLTKYIAISMLISAVLNIVLDPILIFGLHLGVAGAALATTISILVSGIYVFYIFIRKSSIKMHWNFFNIKKNLMMEIIKIGIPNSLNMLSISISFMLLNNLVSSISQTAMNSWTLVGRVDNILFLPVIAFSSATITMIGQNYGQGNLERIKRICKVNVIISIFIVIGLALLYNLAASYIFQFFTSVPEVVKACNLQVRITSFTFIGIAISIIVASVFQATGKPLPSLVITVIRMGCISIPLAYLLVHIFNIGIIAIFISLAAGNLISGAISFFWAQHHLKHLTLAKLD